MVAMNPRLVVLLLCASLLAAMQAEAKTTLPDACGDDKITFDVSTEKSPTAPPPLAPGKARIVFSESLSESWLCVGCGTPTIRFGMDGQWVGANQGKSYFYIDVAPGAHDLCVGWQSFFGHERENVGVNFVTAEAGRVYYFEAQIEIHQHTTGGGNGEWGGGGWGGKGGYNSTKTERSIDFVELSGWDGQDRLNGWKLASWKTKK
jgi:hypothetical protein